jgi:tetratricopeptide (TPR) repeat protein
MHNRHKEIATLIRAMVFVLAVLAVAAPAWWARAASNVPTVTEGVGIAGSVSNSTINNTVNHENPATLAMLAQALNDKDASEERRREAEAKASELAEKLGFTSSAVAEFFKILGEQNVPDEKIPARLIEIATHFAQTRDELAALEPDDPHAAELTRSAKSALDAGRLTEADGLLEQAKEVELAAFRQARELKEKAQAAEDRHAVNAAKLLAGRGNIALTQLRYAAAARHFEAAAALLPPGASSTKTVYLVQAGDMRQTSGDLAAALTSYQAWGWFGIRAKSGHKGISNGSGWGSRGSGRSVISRTNRPKRRICSRM